VLLAVGAAFLVGALVLFFKMREPVGSGAADKAASAQKEAGDTASEPKPAPVYVYRYVSVSVWLGCLGLLVIGAGLYHLFREPNPTLTDQDAARLLVLVIGGLAGLLTAVFIGLALPYFDWWNIISAGLEEWRKNWWRLGLSVIGLFGGLALMLISLQLARGEERANVGLRRLLYGYNAVLTGLLLLAILTVLNVLTYVRLPPFTVLNTTSDWTEANLFTLSPASKNLLASLDKPVKVFVLLPDSLLLRWVKNMMDNCRAVTDKLEVEYISPEDSRRVSELMKKYQITESLGILVVYGNEGSEQQEFINANELTNRDDTQFTREGQSKGILFEGENLLITKLTALTEGKSRTVVYFTQANGELDMNDSNPGKEDVGLGILKERLQKANYDVKELKLGPTNDKVPEDAGLVVIARPTQPFSEEALSALRKYMNPTSGAKKGKLLVLFDVVPNREGTMASTGLEKFMTEFNVEVGNDRVLVLPNRMTQYPLQVPVIPNLRSRNPLATAFAGPPTSVFVFTDARVVQPLASNNPNPSAAPYSPETVFFILDSAGVWTDPKIDLNPKGAIDNQIKDPDRREELLKKISRKPLSVVVAVTEPKAPPVSGDPHAFMQQEQEPRLVVCGDATWIANREMREGTNYGNWELFTSFVSYLRERPDIGKKAEPKKRTFFTLTPSEEVTAHLWWLPAMVMVVGIMCLGGSILFIRRR
jgi:hypothetical protein